MKALQAELYGTAENDDTTENRCRAKKMGVVERVPESPAFSLQPLSQVCVASYYSAPHQVLSQRYGGMHTFEQGMLIKALTNPA